MNYIVTPTYEGHFQYLPKYIESFIQNVNDRDDVTIVYTIERQSIESLKRIVRKYEGLCNILVLDFDYLLAHFNIFLSPPKLMAEYGRFTYQSIKKILSILFLQSNCLILDSESAWINNMNFGDEIKKFFEKPFLTVSHIREGRQSDFFMNAVYNIENILGCKLDAWTLENFMWFVDYGILNDLITQYGTILDMAQKVKCMEIETSGRYDVGIMEALLYQEYIYINASKYDYKIIWIDDLMRERLPKREYKRYFNRIYGYEEGNIGFAEHALEYLTSANVNSIAKIFSEYNQKIIRCDNSKHLMKYLYQKKLFKNFKPYILAASQDNWWV